MRCRVVYAMNSQRSGGFVEMRKKSPRVAWRGFHRSMHTPPPSWTYNANTLTFVHSPGDPTNFTRNISLKIFDPFFRPQDYAEDHDEADDATNIAAAIQNREWTLMREEFPTFATLADFEKRERDAGLRQPEGLDVQRLLDSDEPMLDNNDVLDISDLRAKIRDLEVSSETRPGGDDVDPEENERKIDELGRLIWKVRVFEALARAQISATTKRLAAIAFSVLGIILPVGRREIQVDASEILLLIFRDALEPAAQLPIGSTTISGGSAAAEAAEAADAVVSHAPFLFFGGGSDTFVDRRRADFRREFSAPLALVLQLWVEEHLRREHDEEESRDTTTSSSPRGKTEILVLNNLILTATVALHVEEFERARRIMRVSRADHELSGAEMASLLSFVVAGRPPSSSAVSHNSVGGASSRADLDQPSRENGFLALRSLPLAMQTPLRTLRPRGSRSATPRGRDVGQRFLADEDGSFRRVDGDGSHR